MNWLDILIPDRLASTAIALTSAWFHRPPALDNPADLFLLFLLAALFWVTGLAIGGTVIYCTITHLFARAVRRSNTPGGPVS